jgi:hypothetical protein
VHQPACALARPYRNYRPGPLRLKDFKKPANAKPRRHTGYNKRPAGLAKLQQLKTLYLYQTEVNSTGWLSLKKAFPHTLIDTGGYAVPTLASDTVEVTAAKN